MILTGSSDGLIRAVQIFPTKFLGIVADHGDFPIERIKLDRNAKWLGSASHDEVLKLTDIEDALEDSDNEGVDEETESGDPEVEGETQEAGLGDVSHKKQSNVQGQSGDPDDDDDDDDSDNKKGKKRRKKTKDSMNSRKKADNVDKSFFADL